MLRNGGRAQNDGHARFCARGEGKARGFSCATRLAALWLVAGLSILCLSGSQALAADESVTPIHHTTRLILLGTAGGPGIVRQRSEPASLLVVDGKPYLIDAGESVSRQIVLAGFQVAHVHTIFITHHHIDHDAGLPALISLDWFGSSLAPNAPAPFNIYGPPATEYLVDVARSYVGVSERIFRAGIPHLRSSDGMFVAHDISHDGLVYQDDRVKVIAAENTHFSFKSQGEKSGQDRSYSYRFDTPNGSIVFTGDTGPSEAVTKLAKGADVLVSEVRSPLPAGPATNTPPASTQPPNPAMAELINHLEKEHLTPGEVGKMAARARVKAVILTHFAPSTEADVTKFTAGVRSKFSGTVIPGNDFLEYDLD